MNLTPTKLLPRCSELKEDYSSGLGIGCHSWEMWGELRFIHSTSCTIESLLISVRETNFDFIKDLCVYWLLSLNSTNIALAAVNEIRIFGTSYQQPIGCLVCWWEKYLNTVSFSLIPLDCAGVFVFLSRKLLQFEGLKAQLCLWFRAFFVKTNNY